MEKNEILQYAAVFVLAAAIAWGAMGMLMPKSSQSEFEIYSATQSSAQRGYQAAPQPFVQTGASGNAAKSASNEKYFEQKGQSYSDECGGDLKDVTFVQHLSHHPDQYADCLKKVDPSFLKEATGYTLEQLLG